jgi:hypothetical protein
LAGQAKREREAIAANRLWSSGPLPLIDPLLDLGLALGSSVYKYYAGDILIKLWPVATLRWLRRGLGVYLAIAKAKRTLLR